MKTIKDHIADMRQYLIDDGQTIKTQSWQGSTPLGNMVEVLHLSTMIPMEEDEDTVASETNARMPWAKEHFGERVGGEPLNPPPSFTRWSRNLEEYFAKGFDKFSHSYPERMWSKGLHTGIRYDIADLNTLVKVLKKDPTTRQAFLPFFFPEDLTASLQGERVPCSLGWHFIVRNDRLDVMYALRSCDAFRHLHHDIYFTNMLAIWVKEKTGLDVHLGEIHLVITSLHCFEGDISLYKKGLIK